jgi:anti-sigma B factor antagonist
MLAPDSSEELVGSFYISEDVTRDGIVVLAAGGEIDLAASPELRKCIATRMKAGSRRLMLDLSPATFIDSTAIGVIASSAARLNEIGGSLTLVCASGNDRVLHILEIAGMPAVLELHSSRDDALAVLAGTA